MFKTIIGSLFLGILFFSCEKPPEYSDTPVIAFSEIKKIIIPGEGGLSAKDSIVIVLTFEDGDGDLGIDQDEAKLAPYNTELYGNKTILPADTIVYPPQYVQVGDKIVEEPGSTTIIPADTIYDHVNFYINEYVKRNGEFVALDLDGSKGGRFDPFLTTGKKGIIDGTLEHSFTWVHADIYNSGKIGIGDTVRFDVFVLDRALNVSNVIQTTPIVVLVK